MNGKPKVELTEIPDYIRDELAAVTLACVKDFLLESERGCSDGKDN